MTLLVPCLDIDSGEGGRAVFALKWFGPDVSSSMPIQLLSGLERGGAASASVRPRELRMGILVRAQVVSITECGGTELASKLSLGPEMNEFVTRQTLFLCETRRTRRASKRFQAEVHFRAFSCIFVLS